MKSSVKTLFAVSLLALAAQAGAQVTFSEQDAFQGRTFTTARSVGDMGRAGFDDRASSVHGAAVIGGEST